MTILGAKSAGITSSRTTSQSRTQAKGTPLQRDGSDSGTHAPSPWGLPGCVHVCSLLYPVNRNRGTLPYAAYDNFVAQRRSDNGTSLGKKRFPELEPTREDNPDTKPHDVVFGPRDGRGRRRPGPPMSPPGMTILGEVV
ncbi:hypothetical protein PG988_016262 [Apiospora saccharicola]